MLNNIQVGDYVVRKIAGELSMELIVTKITNDRIICGDWQFDRQTGAEIDEELNWGPPPKHTGSFLLPNPVTYKYN